MKRNVSVASDIPTARQDLSASTLSEHRLFLKRDWGATEDLDSIRQSRRAKGSSGALERLRTRAVKSKVTITPEVAARAVAEYLLPMFEQDSRKQVRRTREATYSCKTDRLPPLQPLLGTVFGELKLSEQLNTELVALRLELQQAHQGMQDALQTRESTMSQFETLQRDLLKARTDLTLLGGRLGEAQRQHQETELRCTQAEEQLTEYRDLYQQCETEKKQLSSLLHEERARCDKLRNKATELEHGNSLLKMENDIIGERLKGLYEATQQVAGRNGLEAKLSAEFDLLGDSLNTLTSFTEDTIKNASESLYERDQLRDDYGEMARLRRESKEERDHLAVNAKEQILILQTALDKLKEQLDTEREETSKLQKQLQDLADEHDKLRQKMKQNRIKRKQYGEAEEKICKKCQRIFTDGENFNWSCRTHKSEYGDEMWWCCGKTSRDAPGCIVAKHQSKEDEEDDGDVKAKEENERMALVATRCSSCKELGHHPRECPRDPNIRSRKDTVEELKRLELMHEKKKQEANGLELHQTMMGLFNERFGDMGFGHDFESSSDFSESSHSVSMTEAQRNFFSDVMRIKGSVVFDPLSNKIIIPDQPVEESLRRSKSMRRKASPLPTDSANVSRLDKLTA